MRRAAQGKITLVALVAAIVLVAQSFLTASAVGAMPFGPGQDAFGNPLCITSTGHDGGGRSSDHSGLPDCCSFGCSMVSPLLPAPDGNAVGLVHPSTFSGLLFAPGKDIAVPAQDYDPGSPRAPPLTV